MNPSTTDVKDMLVDDSLGTFGTDLFIGAMPTTPDLVTVLTDTGGWGNEPNYDLASPTIQVRTRAQPGGYLAAYNRAKAVSEALHVRVGETKNSTVYVGIWQQGDILYLGLDDTERPMFSVNFRLQRQPA